MTNYYCDSDRADDTGDGLSWANAKKTLTAALTIATTAGDHIFCKGTNGFSEITTATISISQGTDNDDPRRVYACLDATINEPPVGTDLVTDYSDTEGALLKADTNFDISIQQAMYFYGFTLNASNNFNFGSVSGGCNLIFENCSLTWGEDSGAAQHFRIGGSSAPYTALVTAFNSTVIWGSTTGDNDQRIDLLRGAKFLMYGGAMECTGTDPTYLFRGESGFAGLYGVDFSDLTGTTTILENTDATNRAVYHLEVENCYVPSGGFNLFSDNAFRNNNRTGYMVGCTDDTTLGTGDSVHQFKYESRQGDVENSTKTRTGGATDGATGSFSYSIDVRGSSTYDGYVGAYSPWMTQWVDGDGSAKTVKVYICREGASSAPTALQDDEVWIEVMGPSNDSSTDAGRYPFLSTRLTPLDTPSNLTTDATSTWSGTAANQTRQEISLNISPDYSGPVKVRVVYAKNIASPGVDDTLYFDPIFEVL